jgi:anaerobic magnesium-protoporphyrin IX monomethyl ester cyclase
MHITLICADAERWALGMRSISASLKAAGHHTRMIFAGNEGGQLKQRAFENIRSVSEQSGLIGISSMSRASGLAKTLIADLRPLQKPIVWGGIHPTLFPEDCVSHADLICRGDGEGFMVELAERLTSGRSYRDIRNAGYEENGQLALNEIRPLIDNLDLLPMPDFAFEEEYRLDEQGNLVPNASMREASSILFMGSRGCVCNCHYCSNTRLKDLYAGKGRFTRKMSPAKFVESACVFREMFPAARYFYFTDEDFFARPVAEIEKFSELYSKTVKLPFECMASPQQITEKKMALLVKAGLWRIDVGVESGSERVKKEIFNRPVTNNTVLEAAGIINRYPHVVVYYFLIIGNPYEQREDLLKTVELLRGLPAPHFLRTYSLVFFPGTHLFERARRDGIISGPENSGYEIDFMAGFDYRTHPWKKRDLYLNSLLALMTGKSTSFRLGSLPRFLLPLLTFPRMIDLNDRCHAIGKFANSLARGVLRVRRKGLVVVSKIFRDPSSAYNLAGVIGKRALRIRS